MEFANLNRRTLPSQDVTELQRTVRELTRLRKVSQTRGGNTAELAREIRQLETRCEQIVSHR
jgi:hypothetical protein